jgi:hypothetical protein
LPLSWARTRPTNLSPAVIARLTAEWQADYDAWRRRDLSARRYVYVWADGVYLQAHAAMPDRDGDHMYRIKSPSRTGHDAEHMLDLRTHFADAAIAYVLLCRRAVRLGLWSRKLRRTIHTLNGCAFSKQIDREAPKDLDLHLIADNYATHKHPKVKAWLERHPRSCPTRCRPQTLHLEGRRCRNPRQDQTRPRCPRPRQGGYVKIFESQDTRAERAHTFGQHLSAGEQPMLAIGRALMTNPWLLLYDATEGLAPVICQATGNIPRSSPSYTATRMRSSPSAW